MQDTSPHYATSRVGVYCAQNQQCIARNYIIADYLPTTTVVRRYLQGCRRKPWRKSSKGRTTIDSSRSTCLYELDWHSYSCTVSLRSIKLCIDEPFPILVLTTVISCPFHADAKTVLKTIRGQTLPKKLRSEKPYVVFKILV